MKLPSITGYSAVWNSRFTQLDGVAVEYFRRGAFAASLNRQTSITATIGHFRALTLASGPAVTCREDATGLLVTIQPDDSPHARLLIDAMHSGGFASMSLTYVTYQARTYLSGREPYREVGEAALREVCVTAWPRGLHTLARVVGSPAWAVDSEAAAKLTRLCLTVQERDGFGFNPSPVDMENEYDDLACV